MKVIMEGNWKKYEEMRVIEKIEKEEDVQNFGRSMEVINGEEEKWIIKEKRKDYDLLKIKSKK